MNAVATCYRLFRGIQGCFVQEKAVSKASLGNPFSLFTLDKNLPVHV